MKSGSGQAAVWQPALKYRQNRHRLGLASPPPAIKTFFMHLFCRFQSCDKDAIPGPPRQSTGFGPVGLVKIVPKQRFMRMFGSRIKSLGNSRIDWIDWAGGESAFSTNIALQGLPRWETIIIFRGAN